MATPSSVAFIPPGFSFSGKLPAGLLKIKQKMSSNYMLIKLGCATATLTPTNTQHKRALGKFLFWRRKGFVEDVFGSSEAAFLQPDGMNNQ